jgi:hypothetical protein
MTPPPKKTKQVNFFLAAMNFEMVPYTTTGWTHNNWNQNLKERQLFCSSNYTDEKENLLKIAILKTYNVYKQTELKALDDPWSPRKP